MNPVPDLTIVLLGQSGVGKSASGNTILGREAFESRKRGFRSVTTEVSEVQETVFGKRISIVDTPGILTTTAENKLLIKTRCMELLNSSRPCLFLLVIKIDLFTEEQRRAADAAIKVIGDEGFKNCFLLFTGEDRLEDMTLEEFINEDPEGPLKEVVDRFKGRLHPFNNSNGGPEQVRDLLEKSGHLQDDVGPAVERRIVLLGLPGAGKSATGNTILGPDQFLSTGSFDPVSFQTASGSARVEGRQVTVVDTPGFTAKCLSPKNLFYEIMESVKEAQPGPHAFIIVVKIDKILKEHIKMFRILRKLFGRDSANNAMVVFTHGDDLKGQSMDVLIQANRHVKKLVSRCDGRFCVFNNTQRANRKQVRNLLDKIDQMITVSNVEYYTSEMFKDIQSLPMKLSLMWDSIKEWWEKTLKTSDADNDGYDNLNETDSDDDDAQRVLLAE